jgi:DNA-binding LacI/PurR family transcriptional regulator/GAF domain-containing protein
MSGDEYRVPGRQNSRPTIALIADDIVYEYQAGIWSGVIAAARERDVNLICFAGKRLHSIAGFEAQGNVVYDLVSAERVDGLVILTAALGSRVGLEGIRAFCESYRALPMVSVGLALEGIPSVLVDNEKGLRDVLVHLIENHSYRRIAFIRGPTANAEAEQRYQTYARVLTEHGLTVAPDLVAPGDFLRSSGVTAVSMLLDEREADFEAIVAANDEMALGALEALRARGIRVPHDVVLVGFDDIEEARLVTPPLTTVQQPLHEQGQHATAMLLALLASEQVPEQVTLPTSAVVRQSCGCLSPAVIRAAAGPVVEAGKAAAATTWAPRREEILVRMTETARDSDPRFGLEWATLLLDAFTAELTGKSPGAFLSALDDALHQVAEAGGDVAAWHAAVSALRRSALPTLVGSGHTLSKAEDLWSQAQVMIGEAAQRTQAYRGLQARQRVQIQSEVGASLLSTFDVEGLMDVLAEGLPKLGIPGCYLSLYENSQSPAEWSWLMLAYDEGRRVELETGGRRFSSRQLIPEDLRSQDRQFSFVVEPLYSKGKQLGFAVFEAEPPEAYMCETVRGQISSALQGALLVEELEERGQALLEANRALERHAAQLATSAEVGRAITSVLDIDRSLRQTVNLIHDRLGFYHVGIFLLNETGEWAVLREATGEAGARMKAQEYRLAVDENSLVGWTVLHRQTRVAWDAEDDAVRFANPLLPYTRSELTLPLVVGERVLGVLDVQSAEEAAFDRDDVRGLQSMADQIAIRIESARRISDEAAVLEMTSPIYRTSRQLTKATTATEVAETVLASVAETGADGCLVVEFEFTSSGEPEALVYLGVWRQDREPVFKAGMRLPIAESPFPYEMVSTMWVVADADAEDDGQLPAGARQVFQATGARALVNIPLRSGERVIGQVVVLRATPGPFSDAAMRLYEVLSDQASVALERSRLLEKAQRRAKQEMQARELTDRIRRAVDVEQALSTAAQELSQAIGVPHVAIELGLGMPGQE